MAAPFPTLPKVSDENLEKWMRHWSHRDRPRLKPSPSAPTIGIFTLTATVWPKRRPQKRSRGLEIPNGTSAKTPVDESVPSSRSRSTGALPRPTSVGARSLRSLGTVSPSTSGGIASPIRKSKNGRRTIFGATVPMSRRLSTEASATGTTETLEECTTPPVTHAKSLPAKCWSRDEDSDVPPSSTGFSPSKRRLTFDDKDLSSPPSRRSTAKPAYLRLYEHAKTKQELDGKEEKEKRRQAVASSEKRREEQKKKILEEQAAQRALQQKSRNDRRMRRQQQMETQEAMFMASPKGAACLPALSEYEGNDGHSSKIVDSSAPGNGTFTSTYAGTDVDEEDDWLRDDSQESEGEIACEPIPVELPLWYPEKVPLVTLDPLMGPYKDGHLQEPSPPSVECLGAGKILVQWELPKTMHISLMWHLRVRRVGSDRWLLVDMDAGTASTETLSWKHRACVVQPGLRVWAYCTEGSGRSSLVRSGTILARSPGIVVVYFDEAGPQQVPQDWVQYAAIAKGAQQLQEEFLAHLKAAQYEEGDSKRNSLSMWHKVRKDWWKVASRDAQKKQRSRRQCPIIYTEATEEPVPGDRVAVSVALALTSRDGKADPNSAGSVGRTRDHMGTNGEGFDAMNVNSFIQKAAGTASSDMGDRMVTLPTSFEDELRKTTMYSWWPAIRCAEGSDVLDEDDNVKDRPADLCMNADLPLVLEPWPRVQVVPRAFISNRGCSQANLAAKNLCLGQEVLSHYHPTLGMVPSAALEESLRHPDPMKDGDVTLLQFGANRSQQHSRPTVRRSERTLRAEVKRDFVSAAETFVTVRYRKTKEAPASTAEVPLLTICEILASREDRMTRKTYEKKVIESWTFERDPKTHKIRVFAIHELPDGSLLEPAELLEGQDVQVRVGPDGSRVKRPVQGKITHIRARPTHFEVSFEDVVPAAPQYVSSDMLHAIFEEEGPERWKKPSVVVHDLPDDFDDIEVQVGVTSGMKGARFLHEVLWSETSQRITVQTRNETLFAPVGPVGWPVGVSTAEVSWLCPTTPVAQCFRLRMRQVGSKQTMAIRPGMQDSWKIVDDNYQGTGLLRVRDPATGEYWVEQEDGTFAAQAWDYIDSHGRVVEPETSMAWHSRIVPLVKDLWVLAYGQVEGQKMSTPAPAVVYEIGDDELSTVKVQFAQQPQDLILGSEEMMDMVPATTTSANNDFTTPQEIPIEWIEAVWVQDGKHFLKGRPSMICKDAQNVRFERDIEGFYLAYLRASKEPIPGLATEPMVVAEFRGRKARDGVYLAQAMVGSVVLKGLQPKCDYEICCQALTFDGWTPWTEAGSLKMPKTSYEQEELVVERQANALYKSALLPHAFYKEYASCRETIQNLLTEDRYNRLKNALEREVDGGDPHFRGWLVNMNGPIRGSAKMTVQEARAALRNCVNRGADPNHRDYSTGRTPLLLAVEYFQYVQKMEVVKELVDLKAQVDAMNDARQTALCAAAERGHDEIVEYFLNECDADATIINLSGRTAYLSSQVQLGMSEKERLGIDRCRKLLREKRVPWERFEEEILSLAEAHPDDPELVARAFLKLAFPDMAKLSKGALFITDPTTKLGKRICKHDRLRLFEQIEEGAELGSSAEQRRRGVLCGQKLLLPQMHAASTPPLKKDSSLLTWYLLYSDVARFVIKDVRATATSLLDMHEVQLKALHSGLQQLPFLTKTATSYPQDQSGAEREPYNGNPLHQWHAHSDLDWLTQQNVVNAFEAMINSGAYDSLEDFCTWIGELNALINACDADPLVKPGNWDNRLPDVFWGASYVQWLLAEAERVAPHFHKIARNLVNEVGGKDVGVTIRYDSAPNKGKARVEKKQKDYASPGLHILHEALDLMPGQFSKALRADLGGGLKEVLPPKPCHDPSVPILILTKICTNEEETNGCLKDAAYAVSTLKKQADEAERQAKKAAAQELVLPEEHDLDAAVAALRRTTYQQISEMRSLGQPPARLLKAAEATSLLLFGGGKERHQASPTGSHHRRIVEVANTSNPVWVAFLKDVLSVGVDNFRQLFEEFDKDAVTSELIARIEPIVKSKDFQPSAFQKGDQKSSITLLRPLVAWINAVYKYHRAAVGQRKSTMSRSHSNAGSGVASEFTVTMTRSSKIWETPRPLIVVALVRYPGVKDVETKFQEAKQHLLKEGADAVVAREGSNLEGGGARILLENGLADARERRGLLEDERQVMESISSEKAQILFEMRKCNTAYPGDLLCAGGLLDLVRGSIVCTTEEQVRNIFDAAMNFTIKDDGCQVVRIKNGFHTPAVGGYCDLKLFLFIAKDEYIFGGRPNKCYHICELQVHLQSFLDCKQYTHLPYQADRGDFDPG